MTGDDKESETNATLWRSSSSSPLFSNIIQMTWAQQPSCTDSPCLINLESGKGFFLLGITTLDRAPQRCSNVTNCQSWQCHLEKTVSEPIKICLTTWLQRLCSWQKLGSAAVPKPDNRQTSTGPDKQLLNIHLSACFPIRKTAYVEGKKSLQGKLCCSSGVQYQWTDCVRNSLTSYQRCCFPPWTPALFKDDSYENTSMRWSLKQAANKQFE